MNKYWIITLVNLDNQEQLVFSLDESEENNWFCFHNQCSKPGFQDIPGFDGIEAPNALRIKDGKLLLCFLENGGMISMNSAAGEIYEDVYSYMEIPDYGIILNVINKRPGTWLAYEWCSQSRSLNSLIKELPENSYADPDCDIVDDETYQCVGAGDNSPFVHGKKSYIPIYISYCVKEGEQESYVI